MDIVERIDWADRQCKDTLSGPLAAVHAMLARHAGGTARAFLDHAPEELAARMLALRDTMERHAPGLASGPALEAAILLAAAREALPSIPDLPVHESVKHLLCKELSELAGSPGEMADCGRFPSEDFFIMAKLVLFQRFPSGNAHWEVSGFPVRLLARMPRRAAARTARFLATQTRGVGPFFEGHLAWPRRRLPFVNERAHLVGFYRLAHSMALQPGIKGFMVASWLHSAETHRVSPHLAFLNHPFLDLGSLCVEIGPADPRDGFLKGSKERTLLYESGEYKPTIGLVICSRDQALGWMARNADLEPLARVR
jgi:hypothetical protein